MELAGSSLVLAIVCAVFATTKGRNPVAWFFIGLILHVFGLILLFVVPNLDQEREKEQELRVGQDRIGEQLRQERLRREAFEGHTLARLEAHDRHAGIDTRAAAPPPLPAESAVAPEEPRWYYEEAGESRGPVRESELRGRLSAGELSRSTLVWCDGMADWAPAKQALELS